MDALFLDLKHAARALLRRPGFALLAILTLAVGIGVNAVAFSAVSALLLKPFDIEHRERTGWIVVSAPENPYGSMSLPDYRDLAATADVFESVVAEGRLPVSVRVDGRAEQGWAMLISNGYMELLGERAERGRLFTAADLNGAELPALVSRRFWNTALGGGTSLGRGLTINGTDFTVVGIIREGFQGPGGLYEPDVWLPLERLDVLGAAPSLRERAFGWLTVVGRATPGVDRPRVEGQLQAVFAGLSHAHPDTNADRKPTWHPMNEMHPQVRGLARLTWVALGVVGLVLLIACFNVAGLVLARASDRHGELGLRSALGASRGRLVRQLVFEGLLLAAASGAVALVIAAWSADLLSAFSLPSPIPQRLHIGVDASLVAFTVLLVLLAGTLPALLPALRATRPDLFRTTKLTPAAGGGSARARNGFVIAQIAGSTLFLAVALLFLRSFTNLVASDPGFDAARVAVVELNPGTYGYDRTRSRAFFTALRERVAALPGVERVALADRVPFYVGFTRTVAVAADGSDCAAAQCPTATIYAVGPGHFAALGIELRAGRDFSDVDLRHGQAVILSERTAARFWPGEPALGRTLRLGEEGAYAQVIGVVADITHRSMQEAEQSYVYRPLRAEDFDESLSVVVRTTGDPRDVLVPIRAQVQALDPSLPFPGGQPIRQRMEMPLWPVRTLAGLLTICGVLALALATIGLFGVTYLAVSQRTREFGFRVALGATPRRVLSLVLREGLQLSLPGVALGIAGALVSARLLAAALFGVSPADPLTLAFTALLQGLVAMAACAVPAWRASRADPMTALRHE